MLRDHPGFSSGHGERLNNGQVQKFEYLGRIESDRLQETRLDLAFQADSY
jgi:hypothetical protein